MAIVVGLDSIPGQPPNIFLLRGQVYMCWNDPKQKGGKNSLFMLHEKMA
jgi:hypothetical protein